MLNKPLVSVIMSVYNEEERWLRNAIESILNQTYRNIEFIIILDNPCNHSLEKIILEYKNFDERIVFIKNEKNLGLVESLNIGIRASKGQFIARMDADDISMLDRLEKQVDYMIENKDTVLLCAQAIFIDENDAVIGKSKIYKNSFVLREALKYKNDVIHPTWIMRSEVIKSKEIEGYRQVPLAEDYDLLCRLAAKGFKIEQYQEVLLNYRVRKNSVTQSKHYDQLKVTCYVIKMYDHQLKYGEDIYSHIEIQNILNSKDDFILRYLRGRKSSKFNLYLFKIFNKYGRKILFNTIKCRMKLGI